MASAYEMPLYDMKNMSQVVDRGRYLGRDGSNRNDSRPCLHEPGGLVSKGSKAVEGGFFLETEEIHRVVSLLQVVAVVFQSLYRNPCEGKGRTNLRL